MAEQKESSVLFSLKELMNLEEDRIKQEEQEKRRKEDSATQARMDAERRAREEEEARVRADENRRRAEEQRVREDAARVEAIRQAEIEKARLEAENAARLEQLRHQQEHERHITALTQDKSKKKLTVMVYGGAAVLVLALGGFGFYIKHSMDESAATEARHQQELLEAKAMTDKLNAQLSQQNDNIASLKAEAEGAKDEASRLAAQKKLEDAQKQAEATKHAIGVAAARTGGGGAPAARPTAKANCNCAPGDPLCNCIP